jgi:hypothetical protein
MNWGPLSGDSLYEILLTWWDGLAPSCRTSNGLHLWPNFRLPPDAGGIVSNAAGISPDYFRSVSGLNRFLLLYSRRSGFHPGFSRAASVAFAVAVSSRSKNLTVVRQRLAVAEFLSEAFQLASADGCATGLRTRSRHVCNLISASSPNSAGAAAVFDGALTQCHGSRLFTLRSLFAHKPRGRF